MVWAVVVALASCLLVGSCSGCLPLFVVWLLLEICLLLVIFFVIALALP